MGALDSCLRPATAPPPAGMAPDAGWNVSTRSYSVYTAVGTRVVCSLRRSSLDRALSKAVQLELFKKCVTAIFYSLNTGRVYPKHRPCLAKIPPFLAQTTPISNPNTPISNPSPLVSTRTRPFSNPSTPRVSPPFLLNHTARRCFIVFLGAASQTR